MPDDRTNELLEEHRRRVADDLARDPPPDTWVGKTPEQLAAQDAAADAEAARQADRETAADRRRILTLEQQLQDMQEMVTKMAARGGGLDAIATGALEMNAEEERRQLYQRVRDLGDRALILVFTHDDPNQNAPVPVTVNHNVWHLRRGIPTRVPASVLEVLDHAVTHGWAKEVNEEGTPQLRETVRMSYPYQLLDCGETAQSAT